MRNKLFFLLILISLVSSSVYAETKPLNIITEPWAPFSYREGNEVKGLITEVVRETFREMGVPITLKVFPWKRAITMLKQGKADGLYSVSFMQKRTKFLVYPKNSIYRSRYLFFSKKGSGFTFDGDLTKIRGTVGAMRGYSYSNEFWNTPKVCKCYKIAKVNQLQQNFEKLLQDRIIAFPAEQAVASLHIEKEGYGDKVVRSQTPLVAKDYFLTFRKDIDPTLVANFDKSFEKLKASGKIQQIFQGVQ